MVESAENKHENGYDGDDLTSGQQKNDTEEYNNSLIETASHYSEGSTSSIGSASSTDLQEQDDASSSLPPISFSLSSSTSGPPPELSELMRGLSRFYHGKSESFMSLSSVRSVEDLPKKVTAFKRSRHKLYSNRRFSKAGKSL